MTTQTRPKPKVMTLSESAAEHLRAVLAQKGDDVIGLRIGVKNGGCAGMEYTMDYARSQEPLDEIVEDKGIKILIEGKALMYLLGTEMDYSVDKLSSGFKFNNPNQTSACGCGESVAITPVEQAKLEALGKTIKLPS